MRSSQTIHRPFVPLLLLAMLMLLPKAVWAEEEEELPPDVIEAAERGRQLFDEGQYEEASEHLLAAYENYREPIFLQYIGRCKQELGLYCQASRYYRLFLSQGNPPPELRAQLEERLIELDEQCEDSTEPPPPDPVEGPPPDDNDEPTTFGQQPEPATPTASSRMTDIAGGVLMGAGGLLLAVSVGMWGASSSVYGDYEARYSDETEQGLARDESDRLYSEQRVYGAIGDIMGLAVGTPMILAGLIVFVVGRVRARRSSTVSLLPGPASAHLTMSWF